VPARVDTLALARPRSLPAALRMLGDDPRLTPLAGCTDVYVGLHFGTLGSRRFLDLWGLDDLRGITTNSGRLRIGALATYSDIIRSRMVAKRLPMLAAAGAAVVLASARGERAVPFETFYTGYRTSVRRADELIVAVEVPAIDGRQWWRKVGTRRAQAISKVMIAAVRGPDLRIAFGAVAPTVVLARQAAAVLAGGGTVAEAQAALLREIAPIDDVRSTREYRATVAQNLLAAFWGQTPV
jgi:xanthine dehydrogenase small subunit